MQLREGDARMVLAGRWSGTRGRGRLRSAGRTTGAGLVGLRVGEAGVGEEKAKKGMRSGHGSAGNVGGVTAVVLR